MLLYRANLPALEFSPNDPIGCRSNGGHLENIEYKYTAHSHNFHSLATVNYQLPRGETLFHLPLTHILEIFKDSSTTIRKYPKTFLPAANHHLYPGKVQRISGQQSTAATNSSNQQQQSAAAIKSSNQHQRPSTAIGIHPTSSTYTIHDDFC